MFRDVGTIDDESCREFQHSIELVGRKWSAAILLALARGAQRFGEVHHAVDGISNRLLAVRLKELQTQNLVERTVIPTTPVEIRNALTESGRELLVGLMPLIHWQQRWRVNPRRQVDQS
ncbi:winged helix-turn-helix transcriptional regulator [Amycolatopsis sp. NPDC051903]|uniref:winged helix-turn-helix transcriptional regulator n=1 Tax=Amycolatopsis sp. NPDC051903 TaxID=3363936 RepID=UPI0037916D65